MAKYFECPECGHVFKAPAMDLKFTGLGYNLPGLGVIKCPECKLTKRRKHFKVVDESALAKNAATSPGSTAAPKAASESDLIEESKFEDED